MILLKGKPTHKHTHIEHYAKCEVDNLLILSLGEEKKNNKQNFETPQVVKT